MADNEELLPCPFCGYVTPREDAIAGVDRDEFNEPIDVVTEYRAVGCAGCGAFLPINVASEADAIAAWNKREALSRDTQSGWREVLRMAELYADFIRHHVKAADIEMHPYLPELESIIERAKLASPAEPAAIALSPAPEPKQGEDGPTHRHKKRGSEYVLIGFGKMQAEGWSETQDDGTHAGPSVDMAAVAIYRSIDDGSLWVRPREEFEDGRFEAIAQTSTESRE